MPGPKEWVRYTWDERVGQYRDRVTGRFVARATIREAIDATLDRAAEDIRTLSQRLVSREISLADWQRQMAQAIKDTHLANAAAARGGWARMTQSDYGRVGRRVRDEYAFLRQFAEEIASGKQRLDGSLVTRAEMYVQSGRSTYHDFERREMAKRGWDQERNQLDPAARHCAGCLSEDARGWVAVGELVGIGSRDCKGNDRCRILYRNSVTGEEAA